MSNIPPTQKWTIRELKPGQVPSDVYEMVTKRQEEDRVYVRQFGYARAPVTGVFQGFRFIAIRGELYYAPENESRYFTDILLRLIQWVFGREWWESELAKPHGQRHQAFEWRAKAMIFMQRQPRTADGIYVATMTGPMLAYYTFAYDLFVVKDNGRLDARLLERLKRPNEFQGARHELFAEATCIRAGFDIEHENEADGSTRHAEFTAVHRATGQKVSVEAKSKHRPGIYGQPGEREPVGSHYLPVHRLLKDAIAKNAPHPLVVFLELNLPWVIAESLLSMTPPHPLLHKTLDRLRVTEKRLDPISLLVATNHPEIYAPDEEPPNTRQLLSVIPQHPLKPAAHPVALQYIHHAAQISTNIPQNFPVDPRRSVQE